MEFEDFLNSDWQKLISKYRNFFSDASDDSIEPPSALEIELLINHCLETENFTDALNLANIFIATNPNDHYAWFKGAIVFETVGEYEKAIEYLDKALSLKQDDVASILEKSTCLSYMRYYKTAIDLLDQLAAKKNSPKITYTKATVYQEAGKLKKAVSIYKTLLKYKNYKIPALRKMAECYIDANRFNSAIICYEKIVDKEPFNNYFWQEYAMVCYLANDTNTAIEAIETSLAIFEENFDAWNQLGTILAQTGKYKQAVEALKRALSIVPDDPEALYNLGNVYFNLHKHKEALKYLTKSIELDRRNFDAYYLAGICNEVLSRFNEALNNYNAALRINNYSAELWRAKAKLYYKMKDTYNAIRCYTTAIEINPDNTAYLHDFTKMLNKVGLGNKAEGIIKRIKNSDKN